MQTAADEPVPSYIAELAKPVAGLRIGVPEEYFGEGLDPEIRAAVEHALNSLRVAGCTVHPIPLPHTRYARAHLLRSRHGGGQLQPFALRWSALRAARAPDANTLSAMFRRTRDEGFGAEVKRRILLGTYVLSAGYYDAYYRKAQGVRTLLTRDFLEAFAQVDAIVCPVTPTPAFKLGEKGRRSAADVPRRHLLRGRVAGGHLRDECARRYPRLPACLSAFRCWASTSMRRPCCEWALPSKLRKGAERYFPLLLHGEPA